MSEIDCSYYFRIKFNNCFLYCYTSTKSWTGYILIAICLCVCVSVQLNSCEQNSSRTDESIWTRFSLYGCLEHWPKPYWNWWLWVKGQGHSDSISIFLHNSLLISLQYISALLRLIKLIFSMPFRYALCRSVVEFHNKSNGW